MPQDGEPCGELSSLRARYFPEELVERGGASVLDLNPPAECVNKKVLPNKFALSTVIICHYDNMLCPPCGQKKNQ